MQQTWNGWVVMEDVSPSKALDWQDSKLRLVGKLVRKASADHLKTRIIDRKSFIFGDNITPFLFHLSCATTVKKSWSKNAVIF